MIVDKELNNTNRASYLNATVVGYALGLLFAFGANEYTNAGQPALLYLVPSVILSMVITAVRNKELETLWGSGLDIKESKIKS